MKIILDRDKYNDIWDKIDRDFGFHKSYKEIEKTGVWLSFPTKSKIYRLNCIFSEEQEKIINSIFCKVNPKDMYALNWQHDCFIYNPCEEIPPDYWFYDEERDCNVYFPSYYPNGDYYFFASFDWSLGLYGHPWREEIIVVGEELIQEFEKAKGALNITEKEQIHKRPERKNIIKEVLLNAHKNRLSRSFCGKLFQGNRRR